MTVDDLMTAFKTGFRAHLDGPGLRPEGDIAIRAGIRAVVVALRDELFPDPYIAPQWDVGDAMAVIDKILGSDAGEKVVDSGGAFEGLMDGLAKACVPDAAPAVCVWIDQVKGMAWAGCDNKLYPIKSAVNGCNGCGKPIAFTEAK